MLSHKNVQRARLPSGGESGLFHKFTGQGSILTSDYLFCRFVRSLALVGRQGLGHIGVSKWREELQENRQIKPGATAVPCSRPSPLTPHCQICRSTRPLSNLL